MKESARYTAVVIENVDTAVVEFQVRIYDTVDRVWMPDSFLPVYLVRDSKTYWHSDESDYTYKEVCIN